MKFQGSKRGSGYHHFFETKFIVLDLVIKTIETMEQQSRIILGMNKRTMSGMNERHSARSATHEAVFSVRKVFLIHY